MAVAKSASVDRALQDGRIWRQLEQHLLQEGRAEEVRRRRVGEATGMVLRPVEQRRDRPRRLGDRGRVVEKHELRHAPGCLEAIRRDREIDQSGGLALGIDVAEVGQLLDERTKQQLVGLHRRKVLAVDPDQVDRASVLAAGRLLGHDPGDGLGGVGELDLVQLDPVARAHLVANPGDVVVDVLVAAPGVPVDGLAAGLGQSVVPGLAPCRGRGHEGECQRRQESQRHDGPLLIRPARYSTTGLSHRW